MEPNPSLNALPEKWRPMVSVPIGRQRLIMADDELLVLLHEVPGSPEADWFFWTTPEGKWESAPEPGGLRKCIELLEDYEDRIDELSARFKRAQSVDDYYHILEHELPLGTAIEQIRSVATRARKLRKKDKELLTIRSMAEELDHEAEMIEHRARLAIEALVAESAERQREAADQATRQSLRLNYLAAFFLPLMALSSLFGMNLRNGVEEVRWMFFVIIFAGLAIGMCQLWLMGRKK